MSTIIRTVVACVLAAVTGILTSVVIPAGGAAIAVSVAGDDPLLDAWTFQITVDEDHGTQGYLTTRNGATYKVASGGSIAWTATFYERAESEGACGSATSVTEGSGSGIGSLRRGSGGFAPGQFGLSPDQTWTSLYAEPDGDFPTTSVVTYQHCPGYTSSGTYVPRYTPVFLPGTVEELLALPIGTVLTDAYVDDGTYGGVMKVSYTATKVDPHESPACSDGVDNDGDGRIDATGGDPGCTSPEDISEVGVTQCDNALDDDGDARIDFRANGTGDPSCDTPADDSERETNTPPSALSDQAATAVDVAVAVPVLNNDSDPDGDAISLSSCTAGPGWSVSPQNGLAYVVPPRGYSGTLASTCTITDARGLSSTSTLRITVGGKLTVRAEIDYKTYWYNRVPNVGLFGRTGSDVVIVDGRSRVSVSGTGASAVRFVCLAPTWQAAVNRNVMTVPVDWEQGGRDLMSSNHPLWETPPRAIRGGLVSKLSPKRSECGAEGRCSVSWSPRGDLVVATNQPSRAVNFTALRQDLVVEVFLWNGARLRWTLDETEQAPKRPPKIKDLDERQDFQVNL